MINIPLHIAGCNCQDGLSDVIKTQKVSAQITRRRPEKGLPGKGIPFSIDLAINFDRSTLVTLAIGILNRCPDFFVVVRNMNSNRIIAHTTIKTYQPMCKGKGTLIFPLGISNSELQNIQIELYKTPTFGTLTVSNLKKEDLFAASGNMSLNVSYDEGLKAGVYNKPSSLVIAETFQRIDPLGKAGEFIKKSLLVAGIGAGLYYLAPFRNDIRNAVMRRLK